MPTQLNVVNAIKDASIETGYITATVGRVAHPTLASYLFRTSEMKFIKQKNQQPTTVWSMPFSYSTTHITKPQ
jgi:hypothetical protein